MTGQKQRNRILNMKTRKFFLFLVLPILNACASGVVLEDTPLGLSETRRNLVIVSGEPRSTSKDGRELITKYFDKKWRSLEGIKGIKERYVAIFSIINDRRPFNVRVEVYKQVLGLENEFMEPGDYDEDMSIQLAQKVKNQLYQSRENRNMIDDFKPY